MKLMILSDLHGSGYFCEKALERYNAEGADRLLLLGDILYHGPRNDLPFGHEPKKVIGLLNGMAKDILAVRGNCDAEVDQTVLHFPIMADSLSLSAGEFSLFATHGHLFSPDVPEKLPDLAPGTILLAGHTHLPSCKKCGNFWYLNPGSVSLPKQGTPHSYLVFDTKAFIWKDIEGNEFMRCDASSLLLQPLTPDSPSLK